MAGSCDGWQQRLRTADCIAWSNKNDPTHIAGRFSDVMVEGQLQRTTTYRASKRCFLALLASPNAVLPVQAKLGLSRIIVVTRYD